METTCLAGGEEEYTIMNGWMNDWDIHLSISLYSAYPTDVQVREGDAAHTSLPLNIICPCLWFVISACKKKGHYSRRVGRGCPVPVFFVEPPSANISYHYYYYGLPD